MSREEFLNQPGVREKLEEIAKTHNFSVEDLLNVIKFETANTYDTTIKNPNSPATGLIQFYPDKGQTYKTINGVKYEMEDIKNMSVLEQLDLVNSYFIENHTKGEHPYITVALPGKADSGLDDIIATPNDSIAKANPSWTDKDGNVTKRNILKNVLPEAEIDNYYSKKKTDEIEFVDVPEEDDIDVLPVPDKLESKKIKPDAFSAGIKTNHTIQLGIGLLRDGTFQGGLTKEQEEKLEELGIQVSSRQEGNAVIYEIETKSLNEANELRKKIDDTNLFDSVFTKHFKVNKDGSEDRITADQLYRFTGKKSYKYDPIKDEKLNLPGETPPLPESYDDLAKDYDFIAEEAQKYGYKIEDWKALNPGQQQDIRNMMDPILETFSDKKEEETKPEQKTTDLKDDIEFVDVPEEDDPDDFPKLETQITKTTETTETTDPTEDAQEKKSLSDTLGGAASFADSAFTSASKILDGIGGPGALVSYVLGKRALKDAMQEVQPQKRADLSPLFYEQYRQSKELAKQGFAPNEERAIRERIDDAYQVGLENAVRGTAGNRARFLAQSGVLDSARSSALLNFAAQDDQLRRQNQKEFTDLMMFKENFDQQRSEQQRAEDMRLQLQDKSAAGQFAAQAFSNVLSGLSGNNALLKRAFGNLQLGGFTPTSSIIN